ncbi:hypothetical protein I4U23_003226 [Adineta vaga]|nr:hypothetical protein I4U23_003226 [Adineta vaga]
MAENELTKQLTRIESMTNVELRAELKQRGCSTSGIKKDLLAKLRVALQKEYQDNSTGLSQNITSAIPESVTNNDQIDTQAISQNVYIASVPIISIPRIDVESNIPATPEKNTRTRSKKSSVDSRTNETLNTTPAEQTVDNQESVVTSSTEDNNLEINSSMDKSIEEKSQAPSIDSSSAKSNTIIEHITPLPTEQQQQQPQNDVSTTTEETSSTDQPISNDNIKDQSTLSTTNKEQDTIKKDELSSTINESERSTFQELKPSRSQVTSSIKSLNRSTTNKINLTSELLKTLISDLSLVPESIANAELDALINDDHIVQSSDGALLETTIDNSDSMTIGDLADGKQTLNRTVVVDIIGNNDDVNIKKKQNSISTPIIADEPVRIKNALATDEPPSEILYIRGLTRPFSLFQLKTLLERYGTLVDGEFWLDKIKSQCFVTYKTLEEAKTAREALDGCRWPSTNPKTLSIRFGRHEELQFSKTHDLPPDQMSVDSLDRQMQQQANASSLNRSTSSTNGVNSRSDVRGSEKSKSNEGMHSGFLISDDEENDTQTDKARTNETPARDLDSYFRKTKSKPSIYWLPLTEEQIIERDRQAERRRAEREENAALIDKKSQNKRKHSASPRRRR